MIATKSDWRALPIPRAAGAPAERELRSAERARAGDPPGYPPVHDFVPDLEGYYKGVAGAGTAGVRS